MNPEQVRRVLANAIHELALSESDAMREFGRRGFRDFFRIDAPGGTPKDILCTFMKHFCCDTDGRFNGFQYPWRILLALCGDPSFPVALNSQKALLDGLKGLKGKENASWADYGTLLVKVLKDS